jgi:hypothetical protein
VWTIAGQIRFEEYVMIMSVKDQKLSADPADILCPETIDFICDVMTDGRSSRDALRSLLETEDEPWLMLDDPRFLHMLSEHFVEESHPRLGYYMLMRQALCREGWYDPRIPAYLSCLVSVVSEVGNPFMGEEPLPLMIQSDIQKCTISSPETRRRLRSKIAHLCSVVLMLFRPSLYRDFRMNDGPDEYFYVKHASTCYRRLTDHWREEQEEDLAEACESLSVFTDEILEACCAALHSGLIAPPS